MSAHLLPLRRVRNLCAWALATLGVLAAAAAQAGTVQVTVIDRDGKPAPDVVVVIESAGAAEPAVPAVMPITQEGSRFVPTLTVVALGSTLRFTNNDPYDHHVRSVSSGPLSSIEPVKKFELRLSAADAEGKVPGAVRSAELRMDKPGPIGLGCHIHASMRGQVYVSPTPWFGKTDAQGVAMVYRVPDGTARVKLWHGDQLQDQTDLTVLSSAAQAQVNGQLNFTLRRRRGG
jgi:plastocyanin